MNSDEAHELQKQWGEKPCDHPDLIAERATDGDATDNWRCTECGRFVDFDDWRRSRKWRS